MSGVAPAKGDFLVGEGDQSVIGDGHAMGVTAQITEHILGATERWFRVDHPVLSKQWPEPCGKGFRLSEEFQVSMKVELAILEDGFECLGEFATKDSRRPLTGNKQVVRG